MNTVQDTFFVTAPCRSEQKFFRPVTGDPVQDDVRGNVFDTGHEKLAVILNLKYGEGFCLVFRGQIRSGQDVQELQF